MTEDVVKPADPPKLANIGMVREYIANRQIEFSRRLSSFLATSSSGNPELCMLLREKDGMRLVAEITEVVMLHLGHVTALPPDDPASKSRRVVSQRRVVT